eukprot:9293536-Alexandrium_andersonii.AAC.1
MGGPEEAHGWTDMQRRTPESHSQALRKPLFVAVGAAASRHQPPACLARWLRPACPCLIRT